MISHNIVTEYISVFILAFVFVYSITPWIIKLAHKINFVDNPNARKIHKKAVPLMGGVSVVIGFIALVMYDVIIVSNRYFNMRLIGYLLGVVVIVLVGLIDDKRGMNPVVKMSGQFLACSLFIFTNFGTLVWVNLPFGGDLTFPMILLNNDIMFNNFFSVPILYIWMIGLMNATNFLDNMDGMITGISAIIALGFFAFSMIINPDNSSSALWLSLMGLLSLSYAGSVLGFLPYNFNPAKIFLGDAGSMFIGYFLSSMGILMANFASLQFQSKWFYLLPVILISFAIFDICFVSITRKRDGRLVWQGGKDHTTHRIKNMFQSVKVTALLIYAINIIIVILTIMVTIIGSYILLLSILLICLICYVLLGRKLYAVPVEIPANQLKKRRKMKITILGTAPGKSLIGKSHTAYLLEDSNSKFLIDCGEGTTQKLLARNLVKDDLDFVIITHLHPDHVTGLFILLQTLYLNKRSKDLLVFLPESVENFKHFMETLYIFKERFSYRIIIQQYNENTFCEKGIYPFRNTHLLGYKDLVRAGGAQNRLLSYSMIIKGKKKSLLLSSDIRGIGDIKENLTKCHVLVIDGIHPSEQAIKDIIQDYKIEVYITHGEYEILQKKFADQIQENVKLAEENDEIIL